MASPSIHKVRAFEDSGISLMARITGTDAANIAQSDVSSIAYSVFDSNDYSTAVSTGALTVSNVVFNSLQTDARWTTDSTGYNFRWDMPASILTVGDRVYRVEITITPSSGEVYHVVFDVSTVPIYRS